MNVLSHCWLTLPNRWFGVSSCESAIFIHWFRFSFKVLRAINIVVCMVSGVRSLFWKGAVLAKLMHHVFTLEARSAWEGSVSPKPLFSWGAYDTHNSLEALSNPSSLYLTPGSFSSSSRQMSTMRTILIVSAKVTGLLQARLTDHHWNFSRHDARVA